jgi:hypothetical protein
MVKNARGRLGLRRALNVDTADKADFLSIYANADFQSDEKLAIKSADFR